VPFAERSAAGCDARRRCLDRRLTRFPADGGWATKRQRACCPNRLPHTHRGRGEPVAPRGVVGLLNAARSEETLNAQTQRWRSLFLKPRVLAQPALVARAGVRHRQYPRPVLLPGRDCIGHTDCFAELQMPGLRVAADHQGELQTRQQCQQLAAPGMLPVRVTGSVLDNHLQFVQGWVVDGRKKRTQSRRGPWVVSQTPACTRGYSFLPPCATTSLSVTPKAWAGCTCFGPAPPGHLFHLSTLDQQDQQVQRTGSMHGSMSVRVERSWRQSTSGRGNQCE